jgi:uncharacterized protein YaaN involved in tellurite resistance
MLKIISKLAKSLENSFSKPQTYGSGLEYYIVSNNPQNAADVDRLTKEYETNRNTFYWARGL